jgi:hypothetical protein
MNSFKRALRRRQRDQRGAAALIVALMMVSLVIVTTMVLDFGQIRADRQQNKLAADAAVMAGLRAADQGSSDIYHELGVCGAVDFLRSNREAFQSLPACTPSATPAVCDPSSPPSVFTYTGASTFNGTDFRVRVESPYHVGDPDYPEDSLASVSSDVSAENGCDQIAVFIEETRAPSAGELVGTDELTTKLRSVGRLAIGPGDDAPAMLLLKRTGCPMLYTGSAAGGSWVHVYGAAGASGRAQAGTIHSDSDGTGCGSNSVLTGRGVDGIVAYAAPLASGGADPAKPGMITTVAGANAVPIGTIRDSASNVYGSAALNEAGAPSASKPEPAGRSLVTRKLIDERYLSGITNAVTSANGIFSTVYDAASATAAGFTVVSSCDPATVPSPANGKLFIDCTHNNGYKGTAVIDATTVVFNGKVNPPSNSPPVSLPNATKVYIRGSSADAVVVSNNSEFSMHTSGNVDAITGNCSAGETTNRAMLFVRSGQFRQPGGLLRMCNTTVVMMGGQPNACLPPTSYLSGPADAPTQTPCAGTTGTGQFTQTGGDIDWTAPNALTATTDPVTGDPTAEALAGWSNVDGPEDLALWSESAGTSSNPTYSMAGGGLFNVRGVFMVPNAEPFTLSGGAELDLRNAQYIATSLRLSGNTTRVKMAVDPDSAVTLPDLNPFMLVR